MPAQPSSRCLHGVNLGNWLVLERWMCDADNSPFAHTCAPDEYGLLLELGSTELEQRLQRHRDTYITNRTFTELSDAGVNLVRIPIPYWIFGTQHHAPCIDYLDQAFEWASASNMSVLIDLHTVPGGHNASDNGGKCGLCTWHSRAKSVAQVLDILERLARRYAGHPALFGIEPLNEPANEDVFRVNADRYASEYPARVAASSAIPRAFLEQFYIAVHTRLRPILGEAPALVLHDRFDSLESWSHFMPADTYGNVWLDTHRYLVFSEHLVKGHTALCRLWSRMRLAHAWGNEIARAEQHHHILVGEWSLANKTAEVKGARMLAKSQLRAWRRGSAECFWSLREAPGNRGHWDFEQARLNGWL